ncbi:DUF6779 domain-containing protein [Nocardia wallacei]|uniref:DUF6779 domain-containing protein n=1 Tax=Nocardia wallacei TaxID=480035 RepID=UPI0024583CAD|nr:DUF6779 domain-containing protein [Nocardia wallacei]
MVSPARSSTSRRWRAVAGKFVVAVLISLGLIASVFLSFSNSLQLTRIGLVAALWTAAIGVLAASRYRRESAVDRVKMRDLHTVYELQLRREIAARHEYELGVESRVRAEVGAEAAEMAALRAELAVLRESLQRLFDGDLPVERPALRADVVRVPELPARSANGSSPDTDTWDAWSVPAVPRGSVTPVFETSHPEAPLFASPDDDPVTAETSVVSAEAGAEPRDTWTAWEQTPEPKPADTWTAWSETPESDSAPSRSEPPESTPVNGTEPYGPTPVNGTEPHGSASLGGTELYGSASADGTELYGSASVDGTEPSEPTSVNGAALPDRATEAEHPGRSSDGPDTNGAAAPPPEKTEQARPPAKAPTAIGTAGSRRRRRAEAGDGAAGHQLTVAEIMANLRSEQNSSN